MKKHIVLITGLSLLCVASPLSLRAEDSTAGIGGNADAFLARHPKLKERVLERFDTNNNGVLDPDERAALKAARQERREKMLAKFDTNGDGKLEPNEKADAREKLKKFRQKRQGQAQTPAAQAQ